MANVRIGFYKVRSGSFFYRGSDLDQLYPDPQPHACQRYCRDPTQILIYTTENTAKISISHPDFFYIHFL